MNSLPVRACKAHTRTSMHRQDMQIGAESNRNSPTPRVRAIRQLSFRASALSTVVRRRVSTSEHDTQFCLSTVRCEVCMSSALVDQVRGGLRVGAPTGMVRYGRAGYGYGMVWQGVGMAWYGTVWYVVRYFLVR